MTKARWLALMTSLGLKPSLECFETLLQSYAENHRFYHTSQHIAAMLKHFDAVKLLAERPAELELAIWFHDVIYKPLSKNNELNSAIWLERFLRGQNYELEAIERVFNLVMATEHKRLLETNDQKLIVDLDLTILGAEPNVYKEFEVNIRKEYKSVPYFIYKRKRRAVLEAFVNRQSIYSFDFFKSRFEESARENIRIALNDL